ncbi:MAG: GNAT family N-acetyltransferase [Phycisphaeraceae bacterium]|nr:GNAT family N-acetyltransferase [Phycisphaeraceae bacterium]
MSAEPIQSHAHQGESVVWRPARSLEILGPGLVRTERVILRALREADEAAYLEMIQESREHLDRWAPLHHPQEDDLAMFRRQLTLARVGDAGGTAWRRVAALDDGTLVGGFNLNAITRGLNFEADANWWLRASLTGRGLASEAVGAMLDFAFADLPHGLGLHRVSCGIVPGNEPSERLARRVGFHRLSGVTSHLQVGGRWERHDVYVASAPLPSLG